MLFVNIRTQWKPKKMTDLLQSKLYFVVANERRFKFIQANNQ